MLHIPAPDPRPRRRLRRRIASCLGAAAVAIAATGCISSAEVEGGVLTIVGSSGADTITLRLRAGDATILEVDDAADPAVEFAFDRSAFTSIVVDGAGGDDTITLSSGNGLFTDAESTAVLGGSGNDTLIGSTGPERLEGGPGADVIDGNNNTDVVLGGDDADRFPWVPGDGSDVIDGGGGADELVFDTSGASESIALADVGGHVRLTRDVGAVTMDLDAVERVALATFAGADIVTVGNLAGTDLSAVDIDLAAVGGFDDGELDEVRVPPTAVVGRAGAAAVVGGFGPTVRVVNGSAIDRVRVQGSAVADLVQIDGSASAETVTVSATALEVLVTGVTPGLSVVTSGVEQLDIDLGDGDDHLSTSGNLSALVALDIDGGDGRDTILGSNGVDLIDGGPDADVIDGNQGTDGLRGGDGSDVIVWDPGDGSDQVLGGAGSDRVVFNGSGASETLALADIGGGQVLLTRDVGGIVLGLDGVEIVELNSLGGLDAVTVPDLAGTDVTTVEVDLAASGGPGADAQADTVRLEGTPGVDHVAVIGIGAAVEAVGLAPLVRIVNADAGLDSLVVDGLGGVDVLSASPAATALIGVQLIP